MALTNHTGAIGDGRDIRNASLRQDQQNVDAVDKAMRLALEGAPSTLDRYGEVALAAHRRFAVLRWRGTIPLCADNDGTSSLIAPRAMSSCLAHAAGLAEIATKLQLECATIFQQALVSLEQGTRSPDLFAMQE
jgi:hypothetical protein